MSNAGGIGAFAKGFADSFIAGRNQRRLREQVDLENLMKEKRERRLEEQFNRTFEQREEQAEALRQYRESSQEIQQKQLQLQAKRLDYDAMTAWDKVLDPKHSKAKRKFMFRQMAGTMEIDPKSQQYKDFEGLITGMDDEELDEIRQALLSMAPDATPGQITALSKAIVSGQIPLKDAIDQFKEQAKNKARSGKLSGLTDGGASEEEPSGELPAPTKVPTSRITSKEPMASQPGIAQGGDLPVPGMEKETGEEPVEGPITASPDEIRAKAIEMKEAFPDEDVGWMLTLARDMEAGKKKNTQLKQVVTEDKEGNRIEKWVSEEDAEGMEAPSGRPVPSREEARAAREGEKLADADVERLNPDREAATTARQILPKTQAFRLLLDEGKFETGTAGGLRTTLAQMADLFGVGPDIKEAIAGLKVGEAGAAEALDSLGKQIALTKAGDISRLTNTSLELIVGSVVGLMKTPAGNRLVLDMYEAAANRAIAVEDLADSYIDKYGGLRPAMMKKEWKNVPSFFDMRNELLRDPAFDKEFIERVKKTAAEGDKIDLDKMFSLVDGKGKKTKTVTLRRGKEEFDYEIVDQHKTGLPMVRMDDGSDVPYAATAEDAAKLPKGTWYLFQSRAHGPKLDQVK